MLRSLVRSDRVLLRDATAEDLPALTDALLDAMNWQGGVRFVLPAILADPQLAHYVTGWPRPGDFGVVAIADSSTVGAAWCRTFTAEDPGYGFVAGDVPEAAMGVAPAWRGQGIGTALCAVHDHSCCEHLCRLGDRSPCGSTSAAGSRRLGGLEARHDDWLDHGRFGWSRLFDVGDRRLPGGEPMNAERAAAAYRMTR